MRRESRGIMVKRRRWLALGILAAGLALLAWRTAVDLRPIPASLDPAVTGIRKPQVLDRRGIPLNVTYDNHWNLHDTRPLHVIPGLLRQAFIVSEDQRFFEHRGVDWLARAHAFFQNLAALRPLRGASTISEQVVRLWHDRPRTLWSRWLEGLEARRLEIRFSKADILEFYLNQVPYGRRRRGVAQAAGLFFDRDLHSLTTAETLALAVMVRAPGRLDPQQAAERLRRSVVQLAARLVRKGILPAGPLARLRLEPASASRTGSAVEAEHFVRHLLARIPAEPDSSRIRSTLDAVLQQKVQRILDERLRDLEGWDVAHGATLVLDHRSGEVLAWVNGARNPGEDPRSWFDAVLTPRQPGSALKPFLYAMALERGWTAATLVEDGPLSQAVGEGIHTYHNYSRRHHGWLRVREALGNSLNTPAVRTVRFVGVDRFLERLHDLGIESLSRPPEHYGEGLALGNGEVTLLELARAYAVLAGGGILSPLRWFAEGGRPGSPPRRIFSPEVSRLIAHILSDPEARRLEFGASGVLSFPCQTAVKTGTSSDHRDAWAMGFNDRYTIGVWMGNLDRRATNGLSGTLGPALVLRSVFAELDRYRTRAPLVMSPGLRPLAICRDSGLAADAGCPRLTEWFMAGTEPRCAAAPLGSRPAVWLLRPTPGLELARDPRLDDRREALLFELSSLPPGATAEWYVDGSRLATTQAARFLWPLQPGEHVARVIVRLAGSGGTLEPPPAAFRVH